MNKGKNSLVRRLIHSAVFVLVSLAILLTPVVFQYLDKLEIKMRDTVASKYKFADLRQDDFVFIGIDAPTLSLTELDEDQFTTDIEKETYQLMSKQFPWSRKVYANTLQRILGAGARLVMVDLTFPTQSPNFPDHDDDFALAIGKYRDKVVLGSQLASVQLSPSTFTTSYLEPYDIFLGPLDDETPAGFVNFQRDADHIVRDSKLSTKLSKENNQEEKPGEATYFSMTARAAQILGKSPSGSHRMKITKPQKIQSNSGGDFGYEDPINIYPPISLRNIFTTYDWEHNFKGGEFFKDKIVIIGPASEIFQDSHTATIGLIYGAQLHLHSLAAIKTDSWWKELDPFSSTRIFYLLFLLGAGWALAANFLTYRISLFLLSLILGLATWTTSLWLLSSNDILMGGIPFLIPLISGSTASMICVAREELLSRKELQTKLSRSMSPEVANAVFKAPEGYYQAARGKRIPVTILFSDIRSFTNRTESTEIEQLINDLNLYFEAMVSVVFKNKGTVDKFIGDALMVTWGALGTQTPSEQVTNAVKTAEKMLSKLEEVNEQLTEKMAIGIGIHHGLVIAGEIGSEQRTDFTVIGDAVNLSSRIEALTSQLGVSFLISEDVYNMLSETSHYCFLGNFIVKGRAEPMGVYALEQEIENKNTLLHALQSREKSALESYAGNIQNEKLSHFYLEYLNNNPDWDGIFYLKSK